MLVLLTPLLHALPWLDEGWGVSGWLGIGCALYLSVAGGRLGGFWVTWLWASLAIGTAFHWSPATMAYTISSGYGLGLAVAMPLILWDGLRLALGYWIAARCTNELRLIWLPAAIVTMLLEQFMPGVFPWRLGFMQLDWPWWLQAVDIFGSSWSTFIAFATAGLLIQIALTCKQALASVRHLRNKHAHDDKHAHEEERALTRNAAHPISWSYLWLSPALVVLALNAMYSSWAWTYWGKVEARAPTIRVALVQVDPSFKESLAHLQKLTSSVANEVDLVCWPESSAGTYDLSLDQLADDAKIFEHSREPERGLRPWPQPVCELLLAGKNFTTGPDTSSAADPMAQQLTTNNKSSFPLNVASLVPTDSNANVIDASPGHAEQLSERVHVSAMLLDCQERIVGRYHKRYLMPFGEYVPGENVIPGMAQLFEMAEHIAPGDGASVIDSASGARIGTMLCYEDMVPQAARAAIQQDANIIISLINGSAFSSRLTLWQHRMLSQLRAIENRRTFVRCAATGETCIISNRGEIRSRLPLQQEGVLMSDVALIDHQAPAARLPWLTVALVGLVGVTGLIRQRYRT